MASLSFGLVFGLGQARRFGEPHRGQAHMASVQTFMLRLAFVASVLLLALLIAYLAG
jgi:preprotein translocase subunit SecG